MSFSDTLKRLRTEDNLTQFELSKRLGVSESRISMYERGQREPDFETLEAIADFFNVDMNTLLGTVGSPARSSVIDPRITSDELALLRDYRTLGKQGKEYIAQQMEIAKKLFHGESDTDLPLETAN